MELSMGAAGASTSEKAALRRERLVLLNLYCVQFVTVMDVVFINPFGARVMQTFSITPAAFGVMAGCRALLAGIAGLAGVFVLDRLGRKTTLLLVLAGLLGCGWVTATAANYDVFFVSRVAGGAFSNLLIALVTATVADTIDASRRGKALATINSANSMVAAIGIPAGLYLAHYASWSTPLVVMAVLGTAVWLMSLLLLKDLGHREPAPFSVSFGRMKRVVRQTGLYPSFGLTILTYIANYSITPFLSSYCVSNQCMREADLPWLYLIGGLASVVAAKGVGRIADRVGAKRALVVISLFAVPPTLALGFLSSSGFLVTSIVCALFLMTANGRQIVALASSLEAVSFSARGTFLSINGSMMAGATALAAFLPTLMFHRDASGTYSGFGSVGILSSVAMLGCLPLLSAIHTPRELTQEEIDRMVEQEPAI